MTHVNNAFNRRTFLRSAAVAVAAGTVGANLPQAHALGPVLGTVLDYSAGVPSGAAIRAAGHLGTVRYVSQRRPGAEWMIGKPVTLAETRDHAANGLKTASVYQFGRAGTADWLQGAAGAATHAPQAIALHRAAGGPTGRPIYVAIDDNPTRAQYDNQIRPYLRASQVALTAAGYQTGVYGNYNVIEWAVRDNIGSFYWMHDWGSGGKIHPRTTIHQLPQSRQVRVGGVECDLNHVYAADWGQWTPGQATTPPPATTPGTPANPGNPGTITLPNGSSLSQEQISQLSGVLNGLSSQL